MFSKIRLDLAKAYTSMLVGFLAIVACVGFAIFVGSVYIQQQEQVSLLALEESEEYWYILKYGAAIEQQKDIEDSSTTKRIFYRAFDANGTEIGVHRAWREEIDGHALAIMESNVLDDDEVEFYLFSGAGQTMPMAYMMTKKIIYDDGKAIGTVYAGRDVRYFIQLIGSVFLFLLVFLGALSWIAYHLARRMADKAMIPIEAMYSRQREFTADASHELRTPLSIFMSSVEIIEMDKENKLTDFSRNVLHGLKDETKKMKQLIESLLMLARNDQTGLKKPEQTTFFLNELAATEVNQWQAIAKEKMITLDYLSDGEYTVMANDGHIRQVMGILLDNACKYTPQGGKVQVSLQAEGKNVILAVTDEGCGIDDKHHELIFERFFRVDKMRSRRVSGTGLGLSIAKGLVELNGGNIALDSKVGEGSTFKLILPLKKKEIPKK